MSADPTRPLPEQDGTARIPPPEPIWSTPPAQGYPQDSPPASAPPAQGYPQDSPPASAPPGYPQQPNQAYPPQDPAPGSAPPGYPEPPTEAYPPVPPYAPGPPYPPAFTGPPTQPYPVAGYPASSPPAYPPAIPGPPAPGYPAGTYPVGAYPAGAYPASAPPVGFGPAPGPMVAQIGEITVTPPVVLTPSGEIPLAGSSWHVADYWQSEQKIPTWAIICAIAGFCVLTVFSLLFLLARETVQRGTVQVTVSNGPRQYVARIPVTHPGQVHQINNQVNYVRSLAAI